MWSEAAQKALPGSVAKGMGKIGLRPGGGVTDVTRRRERERERETERESNGRLQLTECPRHRHFQPLVQ